LGFELFQILLSRWRKFRSTSRRWRTISTGSPVLLQAEREFFLYRDFQSRNIMIKDGTPYFIDYQGGRKGALQYDIASLLFDAKADLPFEVRDELLNRYLEAAATLTKIDRAEFMKYYYGYVYIRIVQALNAYGFRGFYERKHHFLQSVPCAIRNLKCLAHGRAAGGAADVDANFQAPHNLVDSATIRRSRTEADRANSEFFLSQRHAQR
jgi:aminoglycoside/choline kinase family phosphotransferase